MAFLEFFQAATGARVIAAYFFQRVTHRLSVSVAAVWAVYVCLLMVVLMLLSMVVIVLAIGAVNVGFLLHRGLLRDVVAGDYLAITLKVHAASKHHAGFYFAL